MTRRWEKVYETALLEKDPERLGRKLDAAFVVLNHLRHDIGDLPEDNGEKEWIENALGTLKSIRKASCRFTGQAGTYGRWRAFRVVA